MLLPAADLALAASRRAQQAYNGTDDQQREPES